MVDSLLILGASGGGNLMYWYVREAWPDTRIAFIDDGWGADHVVIAGERYPVAQDWDMKAFRARVGDDAYQHFLPSPTAPKVKKMLVEKALGAGLDPAPTLVHPGATLHGAPTIDLGVGGLVAGGAFVHNDSSLGNYTHVATNATVGHDVSLGDYCAINPCALILGYTEIGEGVSLGGGAVVQARINIAPWTTVGLQAGVLKTIDEPGGVYIGLPARKYERS